MLYWSYHLLFYLRHCPSNHSSSGSWQSTCKKLTGVQTLDEQNWFSCNLLARSSGCGWSDFNFGAEVASLSFCQAISSIGWAWMPWLKVPRGPGVDAAGACSASPSSARASLCLSSLFWVRFFLWHQVVWLCKGTVPWVLWSKDTPGNKAVCKGSRQGPKGDRRALARLLLMSPVTILTCYFNFPAVSGDN